MLPAATRHKLIPSGRPCTRRRAFMTAPRRCRKAPKARPQGTCALRARPARPAERSTKWPACEPSAAWTFHTSTWPGSNAINSEPGRWQYRMNVLLRSGPPDTYAEGAQVVHPGGHHHLGAVLTNSGCSGPDQMSPAVPGVPTWPTPVTGGPPIGHVPGGAGREVRPTSQRPAPPPIPSSPLIAEELPAVHCTSTCARLPGRLDPE